MCFKRLFDLSGVQAEGQTQWEKVISATAGLLGILLVSGVSHLVLSGSEAALVVASMGASAVLVFAVPHGALSQPWPVLGGNLLSALIGITCARFLPGVVVPSAVAVGLAIWVMYQLGCLHPPGGATALTAVIGGEQIAGLGYTYALTPVLLNSVLIVGAGIVLNLFFSWRRYPVGLAGSGGRASSPSGTVISHDDLAFALKKLGSFVDVTEGDLAEIYQLASRHAEGDHLRPEEIVESGVYSNGRTGENESVRLVLKIIPHQDDAPEVHFRVLEGPEARIEGRCTLEAMATWARTRLVGNRRKDWIQSEQAPVS